MELQNFFSLNEIINLSKIENKTFKNYEAPQLEIRNSIIINCIFDTTNLNHCDLLSTKVYSSTFDNINFNGSDIFSMWFSECQFTNVNFSGSGLDDITFINCNFKNCNFDGIGLKNCTFINTVFEKIKPNSSTFTLNSYEECTFSDCVYKGSFNYQIFKNCKFNDVLMDKNILNNNYGIGNVTGITFIDKFGTVQKKETIKTDLISDCLKQQLFINAAMVEYNFAPKINPNLAIKSIEAIGIMIKNNLLLRNDELNFMRKLYHFFYINGLIAPIVVYKLFELINKICINEYSQNITLDKNKEALYLITNSLYFDFCDFTEKLKKTIDDTIKYDLPVYVKIHYNEEPSIPLDSLINQIYPDLVNRTQTEKGSFIEYLELGQNGLEILNIFIQLMGISVPIIYAEIKEKHKKSKPEIKIQKNVEINIKQTKNRNNTSELIQQTYQLINSTNILTDDQQGYNSDNIKEINVNYKINIQS
ncbi:MAG: pentapeptide repeat-containing protein [Lachnospiraceae bacterium]|nr:pentapeptide repeat-containing protein [Lachnospiraceae bacterium]